MVVSHFYQIEKEKNHNIQICEIQSHTTWNRQPLDKLKIEIQFNDLENLWC
jgi:hypothetical protein